jgi:geranylgeranyl diphosphate synthase type II
VTAIFAEERAAIADIRSAVLAALPSDHQHPDIAGLYRAMRSYPERSGKTLRGLLTLLSTEAHGVDRRKGLRSAAALELFQNWVLVHDDIEDDSEERRGRPALHRELGIPIALNVGDAMHVYMWQLLLSHPAQEFPERDAILSEFLATIHRTAEGQHLDLTWVSEGRFDVAERDYLEMVRLKTGYYTVLAPLRLGALCADVSPANVPSEAALDLGTAFQIRDDVLNLDRSVSYGKEFAGDLYEGKRTLVLAHLFAHASADECAEAGTLLAAPRAQRSETDVARLLALIARYRSTDYAQQVANRRAEDGLSTLTDWAEQLPAPTAGARVLTLLDTVAKRTT